MSLTSGRKVAIIITLIWAAVAYSVSYDMADTFVGTYSARKRYFDVPEFILRFLLFNAPLILHWGFVWVTGRGVLAWLWGKVMALFSRPSPQAGVKAAKKKEGLGVVGLGGVYAAVFFAVMSLLLIWNSAREKELRNEAISCLLIEMQSGQPPVTNIEDCDAPLAAVGWDKELRRLLLAEYQKPKGRDLFQHIEPKR